MKTKKISLHLNNAGWLKDRPHIGNKGFSLMELIVVIAIMMVLVAAVFASSSVINSSYVKETGRGIEDYFTTARSKSMSVVAIDWYMEITMEDGEYITKLCKVEETTVSGSTITNTIDVNKEYYNGKVTVTFDDGSGLGSKVISDSTPLCVYFDSSTGKVKKVTVGGVDADITSGIGLIEVVCGDYDLSIKLFYNTGKVEKE